MKLGQLAEATGVELKETIGSAAETSVSTKKYPQENWRDKTEIKSGV